MSDDPETPKPQEEMGKTEKTQRRSPEVEDLLTPRSSISPTSSTPSSSPEDRNVKRSELFNSNESLVNSPIVQLDNLSLQAIKAHSPEGEVMKFQPLNTKARSPEAVDVRKESPATKARSLEELDVRTVRTRTSDIKAHNLRSNTPPTKAYSEVQPETDVNLISLKDDDEIEVIKEIKVTKTKPIPAVDEISKKLILMAQLSEKSGKPIEEEQAEPNREEDSMEVEASLTVNSEEWDSTRNEQETLGDTSMDSTLDESEQGARSCVAQRTRSHTEEMRDKIEQTRKLNLSKLKEM